MRRVSRKTAARKKAVEPYRETLVLNVAQCEWCSSPNHGLSVHEIARGCHRQAALDKPFATLVLCDDCHRDLHELPSIHAICIGLALLKSSRPEDFSLEAFYKLTARRWPAEDLVERWYVRILAARSRR